MIQISQDTLTETNSYQQIDRNIKKKIDVVVVGGGGDGVVVVAGVVVVIVVCQGIQAFFCCQLIVLIELIVLMAFDSTKFTRWSS